MKKDEVIEQYRTTRLTAIFRSKGVCFIRKRNSAGPIILLISLTVFVFLISFLLGRFNVSLSDVYHLFTGKTERIDATVQTVVFQIRFPRIMAAFLIGGALSVSGASYQGLFKNPMVSPDILGASAGAGFGAAIAILISLPAIYIQLVSFVFGILAVFLTLSFSKLVAKGSNSTLVLVLTGMVIATLFSSFISITKYVADPESKLPEITFWLMGGLSAVSNKDIPFLSGFILSGIIPLFIIRWKLNILSFGDEEALSIGINVKALRVIIIISSTLLTASCVSVCGMVGWIGLVVPHITRMTTGPDFKTLIPISVLIGAIFLLIVDDIARCAFSFEIPLGILTSIIGAPFFLYLLVKGKKGWL